MIARRAFVRSLAALAALPAAACVPQYGQNGPEWPESPESPESPEWTAAAKPEGPCFHVNLANGLSDRAEMLATFACLDQFGAFAPLAPLVTYVATATPTDAAITAFNAAFRDFQPLDALETVLRWQGSPDDPVPALLAMYDEAYERGLIQPAVALLMETAAVVVACERTAEPAACSAPRLARRLLATDLLDSLRAVIRALHADQAPAVRLRHRQALTAFLAETSTLHVDGAGRRPNQANPVLALARFLLEDGGRPGHSPFEQLLPHLQFFLEPDLAGHGRDGTGIAGALAQRLAPLWRDGSIAKLPAQLTTIFTTDSSGAPVGYEGHTVVEELLETLATLRGAEDLLTQQFNLPGYAGPVTILALALDSIDGLYENHAQVPQIIDKIADIRDLMCSGTTTGGLCRLMNQILPSLSAAVKTGIGAVALPVIYVVHKTVDFDRLFALAGLVLDLKLLPRTRFLARFALEHDVLPDVLAFFPALVDQDLGALRPTGLQLLHVARVLLEPWSVDGGPAVTPALVLRPLIRDLLGPRNPAADLDLIAGTAGSLLGDPASAFSWAHFDDLRGRWARASAAENIHLGRDLRIFIKDEELCMATMTLARDPTLIGLITPVPGRQGAAWYLHDLATRGILRRVLAFAANLLGFLAGGAR